MDAVTVRGGNRLSGHAKKPTTPVAKPLNFAKLATIKSKDAVLTLLRGLACIPKRNTAV